jgi:hypothetical protein
MNVWNPARQEATSILKMRLNLSRGGDQLGNFGRPRGHFSANMIGCRVDYALTTARLNEAISWPLEPSPMRD